MFHRCCRRRCERCWPCGFPSVELKIHFKLVHSSEGTHFEMFTRSEGMALATVFIEEAIGFLQLSKVLGDQAAEGGAQVAAISDNLSQAADVEINVVNRSVDLRQQSRHLRGQPVGQDIGEGGQLGQTAQLTVAVVTGKSVITATLGVEGHDVEAVR
jgi:hypothetical protein